MTPDQVTLVQSSFAKAADSYDNIVETFYNRLLIEHPELAELFPPDMSRQMEMMATALTDVVVHVDDSEHLQATLVALGQRHVNYGVKPEYAEPVLGTLAAVIAEGNGDQWGDDTAAAWGEALDAIEALFLKGFE